MSVKDWISKLLIGLSFGTLFSSLAAQANQEHGLILLPKQCVALTQGQDCYADVEISWTSPIKGNYCLYSSQQDKPLACWQQGLSGRFSREFASNKSIDFSLKREGQTEAVVTRQFKVTWVHQKKGQPRMWWRIF